jgi:hypothetical protein
VKAALRKHLLAARARLALALLRLALWVGERDVKPENTSQPAPVPVDPITPEARELLVEDPPPVEVVLPAGDVIRRVVRSPNG